MNTEPASKQRWITTSQRESGFTLVELLVTMLIVGALAAIAIPVLLRQSAKAEETSARSDVRHIAREILTFYSDGSGSLSLSSGSTSRSWKLVKTDGVTVAEGVLSADNVLGSAAPISSSTVHCVAVKPVSSSGRSWRVVDNRLLAGDC